MRRPRRELADVGRHRRRHRAGPRREGGGHRSERTSASTIPKTDFYFVLPYLENRGTGDLEFATDVRQADVFFSIDNTGSLDGETANLQTNLVSTIIPQIAAVIPNAAFGVGRFRDFPIDPARAHGRPALRARPADHDRPRRTIGDGDHARCRTPAGASTFPRPASRRSTSGRTGVGIPAFGMPRSSPTRRTGSAAQASARTRCRSSSTSPTRSRTVPADYAPVPDRRAQPRSGRGRAEPGDRRAHRRHQQPREHRHAVLDPRAQLEDLAVATKARHPAERRTATAPRASAGATHPTVQVAGSAALPRRLRRAHRRHRASARSSSTRSSSWPRSASSTSRRADRQDGGRAGRGRFPPGTTTANFIEVDQAGRAGTSGLDDRRRHLQDGEAGLEGHVQARRLQRLRPVHDERSALHDRHPGAR